MTDADPPPYRIRRATPDDAGGIARVLAAVVAERTWSAIEDDEVVMELFLDAAAAPREEPPAA